MGISIPGSDPFQDYADHYAGWAEGSEKQPNADPPSHPAPEQATPGAGPAGGQSLAPPPGVEVDIQGRYEARSNVAPDISIHGRPQFHRDVDDALGKISQAKTGKKLIDGFAEPAQKGNVLKIREMPTYPGIDTAPQLNATQQARHGKEILGNDIATELAQKRSLGRKGEGTNADIVWRPDKKLELDHLGRPTGIVDDGEKSESHLALAHEMIHARRIVKGTYTGGTGERHDPKTPAGKEELRAAGISSLNNIRSWANRIRVSENSIRSELGFPKRTQYNPVPVQKQPSSPSRLEFNRPGISRSSEAVESNSEDVPTSPSRLEFNGPGSSRSSEAVESNSEDVEPDTNA